MRRITAEAVANSARGFLSGHVACIGADCHHVTELGACRFECCRIAASDGDAGAFLQEPAGASNPMPLVLPVARPRWLLSLFMVISSAKRSADAIAVAAALPKRWEVKDIRIRALLETRTARNMTGRELDLFADGENASPSVVPPPTETPRRSPPSDLSDATLIAAIPKAGLVDTLALVTEAGRRRLVAAVPALEELCRRFVGFGSEQVIPEQAAALDALAMIGGPDAAAAVARIVYKRAVEGLAVSIALSAAARLGSELPRQIVLSLLRHVDRGVRAYACRCVRPWPEVIPILVDLLDDLDADVATAAACALGHLRRPEGKRMLVDLLRTAPTAEIIDAIAAVADADCVVLLARIARHNRTWRLLLAVRWSRSTILSPRGCWPHAQLRQPSDLPDAPRAGHSRSHPRPTAQGLAVRDTIRAAERSHARR
jgi:hypothetical protein